MTRKKQAHGGGKSKADKTSPIEAEEPAWLQGHCLPQVANSWEDDAATIRAVINLSKLAQDHPLKILWNSPSSAARFEMHHLADDIRIVQGVEGCGSLLRQLTTNSSAFEDFRYELRIAGAIGRAPGQKILRLGGDRPGPDIEAITKSGHTCGFACYRAASTTPGLQQAPKFTRAIARGFATCFIRNPPPIDMLFEIVFPHFPITESDANSARYLLREIWAQPHLGAISNKNGIRVGRHQYPGEPSHDARFRRTRLRFMLPVPERERTRTIAQVKEKIQKEQHRWAAAYTGTPIFILEQSAFSNGITNEIKALTHQQSHSFFGFILTQTFFPNHENNIVHRMESIHVDFRRNTTNATKIEIKTFGDNMPSWAGGGAVVSLHSDYLREDWDIWQGPSGTYCTISRPLSTTKRYTRMTIPEDGINDPHFVTDLAAVLTRLRSTDDE